MKLEELIANTPLIKLKRIPENPNVTIYCKLEGQNPGGSVKDRAALGMINGALDRGEIKPGDKLVEATSGNTGIALGHDCGDERITDDADHARKRNRRAKTIDEIIWSRTHTHACRKDN